MTNKGFDLGNVRQSINRVLEDTLSLGSFGLPLDMYETNDAVVVVTAPLIGVIPEKLDVSISSDQLTITVETRPDESVPENAYLRRERRYGRFSRRVAIPRRIDADGAIAELKEGVLKISLPKIKDASAQPKVIHVVSEEPTA